MRFHLLLSSGRAEFSEIQSVSDAESRFLSDQHSDSEFERHIHEKPL